MENRIDRCSTALAALTTLVAFAACGDPSGPVKTLVVDYLGDAAAVDSPEYGLIEVTLETVEDFASLRGTGLEILVGAELKLHLQDLETMTPEEAREAWLSQVPGPPSLRYTWEGDVAVPLDFVSLNLITGYYHLEQASLAFAELGWDPTLDGPVPAYYAPEVQYSLLIGIPETDNAAYAAFLDGFLLLPMLVFDDLPLPMNSGVIAHEYAHRVFHYQVYDRRMLGMVTDAEQTLDTDELLLTVNRLRSLDEGCADFFAAWKTADPGFIRYSLPAVMAKPRNLSIHFQADDPAWLEGSEPYLEEAGMVDPYALGVVYASAFWRLGEEIGVDNVAQALFDANGELGVALRADFAFNHEMALEGFIAQLASAERGSACEIFAEQFAALDGPLAGCP